MSGNNISIVYGKRQFGVSPVDKIKSYPLTATIPINAEIDTRPAFNQGTYANITNTNLLESLVGSLLLVNDLQGNWRQTPFLIPAASTISQLKSSSQDFFDLSSTPFRLTKEALMIYYVFATSNLYEVLWKYLLVRFGKEIYSAAMNGEVSSYKSKDGTVVKCIAVLPSKSEIDEAELYLNSNQQARKIKDILDDDLDVKAILKASIHPHIARWSIIYDSPNKGYNRPYFLQPIGYLGFSLRIPGNLISSVSKDITLPGNGENLTSVQLRFLQLRLPELDILDQEIFTVLASLNHLPFASILKGYCTMILKYFHKYITTASSSSTIRIIISDYVKALAYALIEMGIHGLSHCLMRYLASTVKVDEKTVREFVGILYRYPVVSTLSTSSIIDDKFKGIIDGYIYRFPASPTLGHSGVVAAIAGAILPIPFSYSSLSGTLKLPYIQKIPEYCSISNPDSCYTSWMKARTIAKSFITGASSSLGKYEIQCSWNGRIIKTRLTSILDAIINITEQRFGLVNIGSPGDLSKRLYIPRDRYRRLLSKTILREAIVSLTSKQLGGIQNIPPKTLRECKKRAMDTIKPYAPMLYEALVPYCFDGCFNCVLSKNCSTRHPLARGWIISKSMLKILIRYSRLFTRSPQ